AACMRRAGRTIGAPYLWRIPVMSTAIARRSPAWLISAVAAAALSAAALAAGKTLVYCSEGSPENFTPALNTTGTSFDAARPIYNGLLEFVPGTTDLRPGLAEKWDISKDGLEITFHLRKGVKLHSWKGFKPS